MDGEDGDFDGGGGGYEGGDDTSEPADKTRSVQTCIATFAVRDGLRDARQNRPPYGLSLFMDAEYREHRLRDGWRSIRSVFFAALAVDVVYQLLQLDWVYLGEALIIAQLVALVPYVLLRGLVGRIARALLS
jgi:hypothetical protein